MSAWIEMGVTAATQQVGDVALYMSAWIAIASRKLSGSIVY